MVVKRYKTLKGVKNFVTRRNQSQFVGSKVAISQLASDMKLIWECNNFGCQTSHYKRLIEATVGLCTGEKFKLDSHKHVHSKVPAYTVVVPTHNFNGHSYQLGKPVLCINEDEGYCIRPEYGETGNHIGPYWRIASPKEVEDFFLVLESNPDSVETFMQYFE